jgi:hypothetical protein
LGEWRYSSTHSLTMVLDGGEWSASRPSRFIPREGAPGTHWIGGWVGPRAVLDMVVKMDKLFVEVLSQDCTNCNIHDNPLGLERNGEETSLAHFKVLSTQTLP